MVLKGQISQSGKLMISGKNEMDDFMKKNAGKRVMITIELFELGSTKAQIGFYYGKILRDVRKGFKETGVLMTEKNVDEFLRSKCPITIDESFDNGYSFQVKEIEDLSKDEMIEFIEWVRRFAAENLHTFVYSPLTI